MMNVTLDRLRAELRVQAEPWVRAQQERLLSPAAADELLARRWWTSTWRTPAALWERWIAVLATLTLIRADRFEPTFRLVLALRRDQQPLVHKALGWMPREIARRDEPTAADSLDRHAAELPRTTVRHATELAPDVRARFVTPRRLRTSGAGVSR